MANEGSISQDELNKLLGGHKETPAPKKEEFDAKAYTSETKSALDIIRERAAKRVADKKSQEKQAEKEKKEEKKPDSLSQDDIDAILKGLKGGNEEAKNEKQIRVYDFNNPTKFSNEDKKLIQSVMETAAMKSTEGLLSKRKVSCRMQFGWNDQLSNSEYFRTLNKHTFIYKITTEFGWFIMEVEPELGWALLKQSKGTSIEQIDLSIMYDYYIKDFANDFLSSVREKISEKNEIGEIAITEIWKSDETEGANIPKGAICLMNTMHTKIGTRDGYMNVLLDSDFFDELKELGLKPEKACKVRTLKTIRKNTTETEFSLEIGRYNLEKTDFKTGEILRLDKSVEETLNLVKDDELVYECDCIYTTGDLPTSTFGTRICVVKKPEETLKYEKGSVAVQLFTVDVPNEKIPELAEGTTIESDAVYEDVDELAKLVIDGRTIAKGEVVIIDGCFAVKITQTC